MAPIKNIICGIILTVAFSQNTIAQAGNEIIGKWKAEEKDKNMQMEIYLAADGKYYSKIINDNSGKSKNGSPVMKSLQYDAASKTYRGTMSPPDAGIEINVTVSLLTNDRIKIIGKKFILTKIFYLARIK
jgi:hypothetical protein